MMVVTIGLTAVGVLLLLAVAGIALAGLAHRPGGRLTTTHLAPARKRESRRSTTAVAVLMRATEDGWAVYLTNGQELARYRGLGSKQLALRYLQRFF